MQEDNLLRLVDLKGSKNSESQGVEQPKFDILRQIKSELNSYCKNEERFLSDNDNQRFSIILTEENIHQNINILKLMTNSLSGASNASNGSQIPNQANPPQSNSIPNYASLPNASIQQNYPTVNYSNQNYSSSSYNSNNYSNNSTQNQYPSNHSAGMYPNYPKTYPVEEANLSRKKAKKGLLEQGWDMIDRSLNRLFK